MPMIFSEDPCEWRQTVLGTLLSMAVVTGLLAWRHLAPAFVTIPLLSLQLATALVCLARPQWFRGYYRVAFRFSHVMAGVMTRVVLTGVFVGVVIPMAWAMRLLGKDPLGLKRRPGAQTYWRSAPGKSDLDRMY